MTIEYLSSLSTEAQAAIIGALIWLIWVFIWAFLTKISELIQITNRRERRASWPTYKIISNYDGDNITIIDPKGHETLNLTIYTQGLVEVGGRNIKISWTKNIKTDEIQFGEGKEKRLILNLKKFDPRKNFMFFIQVTYMINGFYFSDYWRWRLAWKNDGYQIKFYPPVSYFWYIIQILKSYFKRRKLHPWED